MWAYIKKKGEIGTKMLLIKWNQQSESVKQYYWDVKIIRMALSVTVVIDIGVEIFSQVC